MANALFPYGISDFGIVARDGYVYVDRTRFLAHLEQLGTRYHSFLRPRRFGNGQLAPAPRLANCQLCPVRSPPCQLLIVPRPLPALPIANCAPSAPRLANCQRHRPAALLLEDSAGKQGSQIFFAFF